MTPPPPEPSNIIIRTPNPLPAPKTVREQGLSLDALLVAKRQFKNQTRVECLSEAARNLMARSEVLRREAFNLYSEADRLLDEIDAMSWWDRKVRRRGEGIEHQAFTLKYMAIGRMREASDCLLNAAYGESQADEIRKGSR